MIFLNNCYWIVYFRWCHENGKLEKDERGKFSRAVRLAANGVEHRWNRLAKSSSSYSPADVNLCSIISLKTGPLLIFIFFLKSRNVNFCILWRRCGWFETSRNKYRPNSKYGFIAFIMKTIYVFSLIFWIIIDLLATTVHWEICIVGKTEPNSLKSFIGYPVCLFLI